MAPLTQLTPNAKKWCAALGSSATTTNDVILDKTLNQAIQRAVDEVNRSVKSRAQRIQKWTLVPKDFSIAGGELGNFIDSPTCSHTRPLRYAVLPPLGIFLV